MSFGNIAPFQTIYGPASATSPGILTASGVQVIGGTGKTFSGYVEPSYLFMNRGSNVNARIQWNSLTNKAWVEYMAAPGAGQANGITAPSGSLVSSWARRSFVEDTAFYGWIWESGSINSTAPTVKFEIRGSDGAFHTTGAGTLDGGAKVGSGGTLITQTKVYSQTITPASVAANITAEQTFTVTGLTTADKVNLNHGATQTAGIGIVGVRVSAADTLAITFVNATAGALTPVSSTCLIIADRS